MARATPSCSSTGWVARYETWAEEILLFDDPTGCREKLLALKDVGVQNVALWMGVGGVPNDDVQQSMRIFAEEVMPALL
jgi:hypothetical protein